MRGARWTRPQGIHLTLKFLGDISADRVDDVASAMARSAGNHSAFDLATSHVGAFPNARKARVLWIGVDDTANACRRLQNDVDSALSGMGFEKDRRGFSPHLTLARFRNPAPLPQAVNEFQTQAMPFHVPRIILFRSQLRPDGAVYSELKSVNLSDR